MNFLVIDTSEMARYVISVYLKENGNNVIEYSMRRISYVDTIEGDARDSIELEPIMARKNFDVIINAVGILNQFAETIENAVREIAA